MEDQDFQDNRVITFGDDAAWDVPKTPEDVNQELHSFDQAEEEDFNNATLGHASQEIQEEEREDRGKESEEAVRKREEEAKATAAREAAEKKAREEAEQAKKAKEDAAIAEKKAKEAAVAAEKKAKEAAAAAEKKAKEAAAAEKKAKEAATQKKAKEAAAAAEKKAKEAAAAAAAEKKAKEAAAAAAEKKAKEAAAAAEKKAKEEEEVKKAKEAAAAAAEKKAKEDEEKKAKEAAAAAAAAAEKKAKEEEEAARKKAEEVWEEAKRAEEEAEKTSKALKEAAKQVNGKSNQPTIAKLVGRQQDKHDTDDEDHDDDDDDDEEDDEHTEDEKAKTQEEQEEEEDEEEDQRRQQKQAEEDEEEDDENSTDGSLVIGRVDPKNLAKHQKLAEELEELRWKEQDAEDQASSTVNSKPAAVSSGESTAPTVSSIQQEQKDVKLAGELIRIYVNKHQSERSFKLLGSRDREAFKKQIDDRIKSAGWQQTYAEMEERLSQCPSEFYRMNPETGLIENLKAGELEDLKKKGFFLSVDSKFTSKKSAASFRICAVLDFGLIDCPDSSKPECLQSANVPQDILRHLRFEDLAILIKTQFTDSSEKKVVNYAIVVPTFYCVLVRVGEDVYAKPIKDDDLKRMVVKRFLRRYAQLSDVDYYKDYDFSAVPKTEEALKVAFHQEFAFNRCVTMCTTSRCIYPSFPEKFIRDKFFEGFALVSLEARDVPKNKKKKNTNKADSKHEQEQEEGGQEHEQEEEEEKEAEGHVDHHDAAAPPATAPVSKPVATATAHGPNGKRKESPGSTAPVREKTKKTQPQPHRRSDESDDDSRPLIALKKPRVSHPSSSSSSSPASQKVGNGHSTPASQNGHSQANQKEAVARIKSMCSGLFSTQPNLLFSVPVQAGGPSYDILISHVNDLLKYGLDGTALHLLKQKQPEEAVRFLLEYIRAISAFSAVAKKDH